ncbi:MAG: sulfotransferase [Bacteroidales bacterium]
MLRDYTMQHAGNVIKPTDFDRQPWWFKGLNRAWKALYPLGAEIVLDKDRLIRAARESTGLQDLGGDFWDEPLERMLWSINHEADLHPAGRFISKQRIVGLLNIRLRAEYWFRKHPEILDRPLYPVWLITGLQRTGTTKLQRLLAADPGNRVLSSWEAINPAPLNHHFPARDKRIRMARISEQSLRIMAPGFFAIHPVEHMAPEEDILLLDTTFLSTTPEATMHVPSYASWLERTDQSLAYEYAVKLLKFLQWQKPARRWVLKSPHHLEFLDLIIKHFGDVRILWTHRNVLESIPSFLSMMAHSQKIFSDAVTLERVAEHWVRKSGYMLDKGLRFRRSDHREGLFADIKYTGLVRDASSVMQKIYEKEGGMLPQLADKFAEAEKMNPPAKYGTHQYDLADFRLTPGDIERYTAGYEKFVSDDLGMQLAGKTGTGR